MRPWPNGSPFNRTVGTASTLFASTSAGNRAPSTATWLMRGLSTDIALLAVVASVLITPALSAPSMPETLVGSLATAITFGMRSRSGRVRPMTRPCITDADGLPWMSMKS